MPALEKQEPITFGATVERPASPLKPQPVLRPQASTESAISSTKSVGGAHKELAFDSSNPYSAFYKHPEARRSMDHTATPTTQSKTHLELLPTQHDRDLEHGTPLSAATTQQPKVSVDGRVKECTMWPSKQAVMDKRKTYKRARGCNLFKNLTGKQRLWAKIIIALLIVAAAVGLGVGISRAVGGGVWAGQGKSKEIPHN